jgi:diaminohydroxyphosphoribosylaminopyrimidine deaminase/5-amino-6-(5-phosphoribosylamino)uracil reductase
MRALCDAILIGKKTFQCDSPMLTVRHVSGISPVRVIIANSPCNFDNLKKSEGKIILFTSKETAPVDGIEIINIPDISGYLLSELILKELYKRNINSIFIEGGAITASHFINAHAVNRVQIFISPKIFGSGINSFSLPPIDIIEESISFVKASFIPMGDGVLFDGTPLNKTILE